MATAVAPTSVFLTFPAGAPRVAAVPVEQQDPLPEPATVAEGVEPPVQPVRRANALIAALTALVVLLAALTGFLAWKAHDTAGLGPVEASRRDALQAARNAATLVLSYDYRHLSKDFAAGLATTTGEFRADYTKATGKILKDVAPRYQAVVVAAVSEASVVQASVDQVVALVFVNQQSASSLRSAPKITQSRLTMTMQHRGGRWLVSKIDAI